MKNTQAQNVKEWIDSGKDYIYIDVRTPAEFNSEHIGHFQNIPLDQLEDYLKKSKPDQTYILSCGSGMRSSQACKKVSAFSPNLYNLEGGLSAWKEAQYPTIKGSRRNISIMRQVQIVVGTGVLIGAVLAQYQDPRFIWLSAFFGAGLLFAGLSNTCAMAKLLAKMPWNQ